jgi:hypothetical protein
MLSGDSEAAPKAAFNLGAALTMQGRLDEAIEALRLAIDSGHPEFAPQALALLAELDGQQPSTPTPRPVATVVTTVSHRRLSD